MGQAPFPLVPDSATAILAAASRRPGAARYTFRVMRTRPFPRAGRVDAVLAVILLLAASATTLRAQRLPGGVIPVHYDLTVSPNLSAATFAGEETIRVR